MGIMVYSLLWIMQESCITLRALNYGNYGILLIMGNAGLISSAVLWACEASCALVGRSVVQDVGISEFSMASRV